MQTQKHFDARRNYPLNFNLRQGERIKMDKRVYKRKKCSLRLSWIKSREVMRPKTSEKHVKVLIEKTFMTSHLSSQISVTISVEIFRLK